MGPVIHPYQNIAHYSSPQEKEGITGRVGGKQTSAQIIQGNVPASLWFGHSTAVAISEFALDYPVFLVEWFNVIEKMGTRGLEKSKNRVNCRSRFGLP